MSPNQFASAPMTSSSGTASVTEHDPIGEEIDIQELKREFRMILHILFDMRDAEPERLRAVIDWLESRYGDRR